MLILVYFTKENIVGGLIMYREIIYIISECMWYIFALIVAILFFIGLMYMTIPNTTNKSKYIGKTKNAVIKKYVNRFGSTEDGNFKIIMNDTYFCRIQDPIHPVWIRKLTYYPPYTTNKDGFKQNISCLPYISIDITNSQNIMFIKQQLGREPISSNDLIPFKQACLKELIEYNISQK